MTPEVASQGWLTKAVNPDGSVSIVGDFRNEWEARKWAMRWNVTTGRNCAFVEKAAK